MPDKTRVYNTCVGPIEAVQFEKAYRVYMMMLEHEKFQVRSEIDASNCGILNMHRPLTKTNNATGWKALYEFIRGNRFPWYVDCSDECKRGLVRMSAEETGNDGSAILFYEWVAKNHPNTVRRTPSVRNPNSNRNIFEFVIRTGGEWEEGE